MVTLPAEGSQAEPDGPEMGQAKDERLGMLLSRPDNTNWVEELWNQPSRGISSTNSGGYRKKRSGLELRRQYADGKGGLTQGGWESGEGLYQKKGSFETPYGRAQVTLFKAASGMMAKARFFWKFKVWECDAVSQEKTLLLRGLQRPRKDAKLEVRRGKDKGTQGQG